MTDKSISKSIVPVIISFSLLVPLYLAVAFGKLGVFSLYAFSIFQILTIFLFHRYVFNAPEVFAKLFVFIVALQNIAIGLALNLNIFIPRTSVMVLISFSSVYVLMIYFFACIFGLTGRKATNKLLNFEFIALTFIFLVGCYFFVGKGALFSKLGYLRNFTLFFFIYLLGKVSVKNERSMQDFLNFIFALSLVLCIFGFIERFVLKEDFWLNTVNIWRIDQAKSLKFKEGSLPGVFTTDFLKLRFMRLASTFGEPVNASYFFSFTTIAALMSRKKLLAAINCLALFLTLGKGGILIFLLASASIFCAEILTKKRFTFKKAMMVLASFIPFIYLYAKNFGGSVLRHISGLSYGMNNLMRHPLGHGLGVGGNWGSIFDAEQWRRIKSISGAESLIGTVSYQMGVIGLIVYICFFGAAIAYFFNRYRLFLSKKDTYLARSNLFVAVTMMGIFLVSFFQENTFGPQAGGIFFVFMGIVVQTNYIKEKQGVA